MFEALSQRETVVCRARAAPLAQSRRRGGSPEREIGSSVGATHN